MDGIIGPAKAAKIVCGEILDIMREYRAQEAAGSIGTPGGLEHMGDVWKLFAKWERLLNPPAPTPVAPPPPPPPVDRTARELSGGMPETPDHREINPLTGQQEGYVVLTAVERLKGFARPYRDAYRHLTCGKITTMSRDIAETYARDPFFYSGTFCVHCRGHFPVGEDGEFTWYEMDGREGPKVGT